ncbi:uroporphyrinogen decarboxylase [Salsuginibacillus halophilus]|uniref:Uroporphyrinogen decarboxylase n=1 Tax=Salsuginibacillus halophilus TaxID=517424 RepID=A0A2P8HG09_9BACI|nr:uroporphyrinogen decarboxylase [Salsuginibacillus halophilus]PSL45143.1 uroporphyrinogen decarboxylase [Salsuginibacillus halophilus]
MAEQKFNDTFLRACRQEEVSHTPVWYMRQAGRSQPEYRALKEKYSLFEITRDPELCAYVTRLPVEQYNNDAAILYKDIMTPLPPIGVDVEIKPGVGPVIDNPIETMADVEQLGEIDPERDVPYVLDTIRLLREQLNVPLISFSGAPFTLASYMIEGGPSKNYHKLKTMMYGSPEVWHALMDKLSTLVITYAKSHVSAGAQALQVFDSWVGTLNVADYRTFVKPYMERIFSELRETGVPLITFGVGAGHLIKEWDDLDVDVIGLDWRMSVPEARALGVKKTLQGNLDPTILLAPWEVVEKRAKEILAQAEGDSGYIFNLGHGVLPEVQPETLKKLTALVHEHTK